MNVKKKRARNYFREISPKSNTVSFCVIIRGMICIHICKQLQFNNLTYIFRCMWHSLVIVNMSVKSIHWKMRLWRCELEKFVQGIVHWRASWLTYCSFARSISPVTPLHPPTAKPLQGLPKSLSTDIHYEDGNCSSYRNFGKPSAFHTAYHRRPKSHNKFQPRKPRDKKSVNTALRFRGRKGISWSSD